MADSLNKIKNAFRDPGKLMLYLSTWLGNMKFLPDRLYLKYIYRALTGNKLNLRDPKTFCEKIQWLKLYDRNPQYTRLADKLSVREYVSEKIGPEHLIPLLGVWDSADEIDPASFPDEFVLKLTHNSGGGMFVCRDKSKMDWERVKAELEKNLKSNYFWPGREWTYKNIPPRIIAEKFMRDVRPENPEGVLVDFDFFCFGGEPKFMYVGVDDVSDGSKGSLSLTYLDMNWKPVPFYKKGRAPVPFPVEKPAQFDEMVRIAKTLSEGIPFVRVDLYRIGEQIFFSELTFYPGAGFSPYSPDEWERKIGDMLVLPDRRK